MSTSDLPPTPPSTADALDLHWMGEALALAAAAAQAGEIPVGAVVVDFSRNAHGHLLGRGFNQREQDSDPSAHAEIVALREAGKMRDSWRLENCTLYVTLEPCPMCAGAIVNARIARLVYGCTDPKAGAVDTLFHLCTDPRLNHRLATRAGVRADEAASLLRTFFAARREAARSLTPPSAAPSADTPPPPPR